jgi:hypothetical protein
MECETTGNSNLKQAAEISGHAFFCTRVKAPAFVFYNAL